MAACGSREQRHGDLQQRSVQVRLETSRVRSEKAWAAGKRAERRRAALRTCEPSTHPSAAVVFAYSGLQATSELILCRLRVFTMARRALTWQQLGELVQKGGLGAPDLVNGPTAAKARLRLFGAADESAVRVTLYRDNQALCSTTRRDEKQEFSRLGALHISRCPRVFSEVAGPSSKKGEGPRRQIYLCTHSITRDYRIDR